MTAAFWMAAATLTALGFLLWPLLRRTGVMSAHSRFELNAAVYRDQLVEIDRDRAGGALSAEDHRQARDELQRRLLDDAVADDAVNQSLPRARKTAIVLLLAVPLLATLLYGKLGNPGGLSPEFRQQQARNPHAAAGAAPDAESAPGGAGPAGGGGSAGNLGNLVGSLAAKLENNPNNPEGWVILGRAYKALGRYDDAEKAFAKAGSKLMDNDPVLLVEQAELAAVRAGGNLEGKPRALVEKALQLDPDNPQALLIAGSAAYFRGEYAKAISHWERMKKNLPPDSPDAQALTASIDKARSRMGRGGSVAAALGPVLADSATPKTAAQAPPAQAQSSAGGSVSGRIELAPVLKASASPSDTVFVFARAMQGPRMPLAVLRARASDLPMDFKLDDSMAMAPGMNLSSFPEIRIEAKVSKSGDAMTKAGDLTGSTGPVKVGAKGVKVTIDQVTP